MQIPISWQSDFPRLAEVSDHLHRHTRPEASLVATTKRLLKELASSTEPNELVSRTLKGIAEDPSWDPPHLGYDGQLLLHYAPRNPVLVLGRTECKEGHSQISTVGATSLICPLDKQGFQYERGYLNRHPQLDRVERDLLIESIQTESCRSGEVLQLNPGDVFRYISSGEVVLKIEYPDFAPLVVNFSRARLEIESVSMGTIEATQIIYLLRLMAEYGRETDVGAVFALASHAHHKVRWETAKALARLAPARAMDLVRKLADSDHHPEIRAAAKKSLQRSVQ